MRTRHHHSTGRMEDLRVEFGIHQDGSLVEYCWSIGMARFGFPELAIGLTDPGWDDAAGWPGPISTDSSGHAEHVVRCAQMVLLLGRDVLHAGTLQVLPRREVLLGYPVRYWVGPRQTPSGVLAVAFPQVGAQVATVQWCIDLVI